jgi:hypothetical protein
MESPVALVKQSLSPSTIIKGVIGFIIIAAIFDVLNQSDLLFRPYSYLRSKFGGA